MGDDALNFKWDEYQNVLQIEFQAPASARDVSPAEVRKTLEEAVRKIPDSAFRGFRSFRITVAT